MTSSIFFDKFIDDRFHILWQRSQELEFFVCYRMSEAELMCVESLSFYEREETLRLCFCLWYYPCKMRFPTTVHRVSEDGMPDM